MGTERKAKRSLCFIIIEREKQQTHPCKARDKIVLRLIERRH